MSHNTAHIVAYAVVTVATTYLLGRVVSTAPALLTGLVLAAAHEKYDAPLARFLG